MKKIRVPRADFLFISLKKTVVLFVCSLVLMNCSKTGSHGRSGEGAPPLDPEQARASMTVMDGFKVELFAHEPMVQDPVAMEVDEEGRMYVVEMRSYPLDDSGLGQVKLLEDTNSDGLPDRSTVFADSLAFPNGVMRWKDGILVTDAPHLLYLEDTTGNGKADRREIVLTGFARSNPQHNVNTPVYGLDNWIYLANNGTISTRAYSQILGDEGAPVRFHGLKNGPVLPRNAAGRNLRFKPGSHQLEMRAVSSQYGHTFDAWGTHFLVSNAHHQYIEAVEQQYLERNPYFPIQSARHYTPDHGNAAEVYPTTRDPEYQLLTDRGVITSASGITYYLGGVFPPEFKNVTFVAESVHNLVHADVVKSEGAMVTAKRLLEQKEFLTSTDAWFRPVQFYIGPDGALYVIDYYRRIIDHPQWMDDKKAQNEDLLYEATERGRIYRITPDEMGSPEWMSNLGLKEAPVTKLVDLLEHSNLWWRRTAQRLLVDRKDAAAVPLLEDMVRSSKMPEARLHALWTLEGLGALERNMITAGLRDKVAGVRRNAIKMAEQRLADDAYWVDRLLEMTADDDPGVRYQLLLSLGDHSSSRVKEARKKILSESMDDPWMQIAFLSAADLEASKLINDFLEQFNNAPKAGRQLFLKRLASMMGRQGNTTRIRQQLRKSMTQIGEENEWWKTAVLAGLTETLRHADIKTEDYRSEAELAADLFLQAKSERLRGAVSELIAVLGLPAEVQQRMLPELVALADDREAEDHIRADAIDLMALFAPASTKDKLKEYSDPGEPVAVQRAGVRGLKKLPGRAIGQYLMENWKSMTPVVREEAVDVLLQEDERVKLLLDAVAENRVAVSSIGWSRRVSLMQHADEDIRSRARELLKERPEETRSMVEKYRASLSLEGDPAKGKEVYRTQCSACHQVGEELGMAFGPDLSTVRHWEPQALISKIVDPGSSIADGYKMWIVEQTSGGRVAGVVQSENGNTVTLRNAGGSETTISRSEIKSMTPSEASPMPSGLANEINKQEMADLIAFIRQL
ncbi:PVC-type heme-binding CxxCH protein [Fodinibius sediminis]|uniref:Putative membrane-bound dehydrogenase domain-containing protein n=1 Tax=Fodinibius sediminis TaxID=1214077 RepID=A0A521DPI6_9BACT|nr:PVC-type heme-binding CxxCH protein [Fodinibius sediminis]SMO73624.1 putative membrane-bound dehydrogenase domain-containing protein [Fodinibius sediminis]